MHLPIKSGPRLNRPASAEARRWRQLDAKLLAQLQASVASSPSGWSYGSRSERSDAHALFQYPAMMVPAMPGDFVDAVRSIGVKVKSVFDPFVGSGTVMTEAMLRGLDFLGHDINPLAILLCRVKAECFDTIAVREELDLAMIRAQSINPPRDYPDFPTIDKWFSTEVKGELGKLRAAIRTSTRSECRRFMWVALAETIRLTSNSRTTTFKLHIRPSSDLASRRVSALDTFRLVAEANLARVSRQRAQLAKRGWMLNQRYRGRIELVLGDSLSLNGIPDAHDVLITSPPYGDNLSTVPYGQHSYLPLQWIDLADIAPTLDASCLRTTQEIDRRSLGGGRAVISESAQNILADCEAFHVTRRRLASLPDDRTRRFETFCFDLVSSIGRTIDRVRSNSFMFWTVGNRRVGNELVPTDMIVSHVLEFHGATVLARFNRPIPHNRKRMASRTKLSLTISGETVIVARRNK